jgi:hypothetical protein
LQHGAPLLELFAFAEAPLTPSTNINDIIYPSLQVAVLHAPCLSLAAII